MNPGRYGASTPPITIDQAIALALRRHQTGQLAEAEAICRQIIAQRPDCADAFNLLGILAGQNNRPDEAVELVGRAIAINPSDTKFHSNLGEIHRRRGKLDEAVRSLRQAISFDPNHAEAYANLGLAFTGQRLFDDAIAALTRAIQLKPARAEFHYHLGVALMGANRADEAIAAYRHAIQLQPDHAHAYNNLGVALASQEEFDQAISAYGRAIQLKPNDAEIHYNLGNLLQDQRRFDEAVAVYRTALRLNPDLAEAHNNLAISLKDLGLLDEAIVSFQRALELKSDFVAVSSNRIYVMLFHPACNAHVISRELTQWNRRHGQPLERFIAPHDNDPTPHRRLKIGYVSPDLRNHVVGWNVLPLIREHDRQQFEVFCYSHASRPDSITDRFQSFADGWRDIRSLGHDQTAELIRRDKIDILVDLTLHMAHNRLLVFARKPAPVQATFAGYPGSTGLAAMDYRLTDPYLDPPDADDSLYSEKSIRLPDTFWCYDPTSIDRTDLSPVGPLPALKNGHVTFACLNNFCKVNDPVLDAWAQVMSIVTDSRLMLMAPPGTARRRVLDRFAHRGVAPSRIAFVQHQAPSEYLQLYRQADLGLDTFPYNGHTTGLDSLWMGVPPVTLVGKTVVGRAGWSQLCNLNLRELATQNVEQFVRATVDLAGNVDRLAQLRATLRERMLDSPLTDAKHFTRNIEAAYRQMWLAWCGRGK